MKKIINIKIVFFENGENLSIILYDIMKDFNDLKNSMRQHLYIKLKTIAYEIFQKKGIYFLILC